MRCAHLLVDFRRSFCPKEVHSINVRCFFLHRKILFLAFRHEGERSNSQAQSGTFGTGGRSVICSRTLQRDEWVFNTKRLTGHFCEHRALPKKQPPVLDSIFRFYLKSGETHFLCHHICGFHPELLAGV